MRPDIIPGGIFPDYALPDHTGSEIRPDWDLSTPGLREAGDAGDYSKFHGWDRRSPESEPTSYY